MLPTKPTRRAGLRPTLSLIRPHAMLVQHWAAWKEAARTPA